MYTVGAGATVYRVSVYCIYCIIYIYIRVYVNKSHTIASATDGFYADIQIMFGTVYMSGPPKPACMQLSKNENVIRHNPS